MMTHISDKTVTARKRHHCRVCDESIDKGETCHSYTGVESSDGFYTLYFHLDCWEHSREWDWEDWDRHMPGDVSHKEVQNIEAAAIHGKALASLSEEKCGDSSTTV